MAIKQKVLPDGEKQGNMSDFIKMKSPTPVVDLKHDPEFKSGFPKEPSGYVLPSYYDPSPQQDDVGWYDMIRGVLPVVDPDRLRFRHDAIVGYVSWVLVCPSCNSPVEPIPCSPLPRAPDSELVFQSKEKLNPIFAKCGKCELNFFIAELVKDRSFRQKFPDDKITMSIDFLRRRG